LRRAEDLRKLPEGTDDQIIDYFLQNLQFLMGNESRRLANAGADVDDGDREHKRDG